jgi:hypothetical protein
MPSVSAASAWMPGAPSSARASAEQELGVAPAAPLALRTVTVVSPPESSTQGGAAGNPWRAQERHAGHDLADLARLAFDGVAEDERRDAAARFGRRRFEHLARAGDQAEFAARQTRVARLGRFQFAPPAARAQCRRPRCR